MLVEGTTVVSADQVEVAIGPTTMTTLGDDDETEGTTVAVEGVSMRRLRECLTLHNKPFICSMLRCLPAPPVVVANLEYHHAEEADEFTGVLTLCDGTVVMVSELPADDADVVGGLRLRVVARGSGWVVQSWLRARELPQYMRIDVEAGIDCARRFRMLTPMSVFGCQQQDDDPATSGCACSILELLLANLPRALAEIEEEKEKDEDIIAL